MKKSALAIFTLMLALSPLHAAAKSVAMVRSFSGNVTITLGTNTLAASRYLRLPESARIRLGQGASLELILINGKKAAFISGNYFELTGSGIRALDKETGDYLEKNRPLDVYDKADLQGGKGGLIVPDKVKKEIAGIDSVADDAALRALLRGDIYKAYRLKSLAQAEFKKYIELMDGTTNGGK